MAGERWGRHKGWTQGTFTYRHKDLEHSVLCIKVRLALEHHHACELETSLRGRVCVDPHWPPGLVNKLDSGSGKNDRNEER